MRQAQEGDRESLGWLVARFTPLLLLQARHRMGPQLLAKHDPEDVVNDVWATALPRLPGLPERGGRHTPVILRFLSTTLLHRINNLLRLRATDSGPDGATPLDSLPEETPGPLTRAAGSEDQELVLAALGELGERDREVIVLRVLEGVPNPEVARLLDLEPNTAAQVYRRALERLRQRLPGAVFDDLEG